MFSSRSRVTTALLTTAVAAVLLAGCGSDEPSSSSDDPSTSDSADAGSSSDPTDESSDDKGKGDKNDEGEDSESESESGEDTEEADEVAGPPDPEERFCDELDPKAVGAALGIDKAEVLVDDQPGGESQPAGDSKAWNCTIGESEGSLIAAVYAVRDESAASPQAQLKAAKAGVGSKNCTTTNDDALGGGTEGADCSGEASDGPLGRGFTMVARVAAVDGTLLECYLGSTDPADLGDLSDAATEVCGMLLDAVG